MHGEDDGESHSDETHVDGDWKVSSELVNPTIFLVDDGEASNKEVNNVCDLVGMNVVYDGLLHQSLKHLSLRITRKLFHMK